MTLCKLLYRCDKWWVSNAPRRRLDRNAGNMCLLIGLMMSTFSIILQGPVPNSALKDMPESMQVAMCICIFVGCAIKLHGALCGSRWYFTKTSLTKAYRWGYTGAPMATMGCFVYGYYILHDTPNFLSALGGVTTPMFGLGISIQALFYWLESRRIANAEIILIKQAKDVIANGNESDS